MANTQTTASGGSNSAVSIQEYSIRVPKNGRKKFHVMRFNATLNVDFTKWTQVKMERENNMKEYKGMDEEQPKFGAGSEFGRESREEARRKKLGFISRSYKPDDQPWILKSGGKTGKKFKGIREGGVSENAAYYVFTHAADGIIEAFPLQEWYNFQPIQRYKALSAEEAEQEFGKRNRVLNYFSLMLRKRLKGDEELDVEEGDDMKGRKGASKKAKDLKISEMDEWMDSSSGDDSSDEEKTEKKEGDEEAEDKKKKAKKANVKKTKKNRDTDAEAFEDSDDGDDEGRELDYISSSSESEPEIEKQLQGVAEEKALRKLLTSDEDSEEEENKSEKEESNDEENKAENKNGKDDKESGDKKKKKKKDKKEVSKKKKDEKVKEKETSSDSTADSTDSDVDTKKKTKKDDKEASSVVKDNLKESNSATGSRSGSPAVGVANKRKLHNLDNITSKKPKLDTSGSSSSLYIPGSSESGITEDAVRRYLMRKPMTTTELLQKFKTKKTGLSSEQLVNIMTQILKKINPVKQTIKGKMYLSIKA